MGRYSGITGKLAMPDTVIKIENLGKKYRLAHKFALLSDNGAIVYDNFRIDLQ